MERLAEQMASVSSRLNKICQEYKIGDRYEQLCDENFCDWDAETQEGMVNALHNADMELDRVAYFVSQLCNK